MSATLYATKDFTDAGTGKSYKAGSVIFATDGELANYLASGLASASPDIPGGAAVAPNAPVTGTRTSAGVVGPFTPLAGRPFNVTVSGGAGVSARLERSFDGGTTWFVKLRPTDITALPESFSDTEAESGVQYRLNVTAIASGTVTLRLSQ